MGSEITHRAAQALQLGSAMRSTVLIVDDEAPLLRAMQRLLNRTFDVVAAPCASAAMEAYQDNVSVVLTDFSMPDGDGLELTRRLRARGYKGAIAVLSAVIESDELQHALDAGEVTELICKPWKSTDLVARVTALCDRHVPV